MNIDDLNEALSDRYRIERELGRGGMAVVYLARDKTLGRDVALKVLLPELSASLGGERFLREIEIAGKLSHPNILPLHDRGEVDGTLYYTMPYIDGESLRDRLDREKQLPIDEALAIAAEVAGALAHAHDKGVVHRDVKPENILLQGGHALVSDFGIARAVTEAGGERLTKTGITVGTVSYMSPEQGAGEREIDGRSDLYSLGCVLYEMIGGMPPFTGPSDQAILARHVREAPPPLSTIRSSTPPGVEAVIHRSLAKNAADRYRTAERMQTALSDPRITDEGPGVRFGRAANSRWGRLAISTGVVAAVAFGGWRLAGGGTPPDAREGVVAVLPFMVEGDMARPLNSESITNMLSNFFDYIERYQMIRPDRVRQAVEDECTDETIERQCGSRVAAELGAQYQVTGTVTPLRGDSVMILAYLTDELDGRGIPPISVRGSQDSGYTLLNRLYQELASASATEGERVVANAALSTENMVAFAALLDGEDYFSRWKLDSARSAFRRATEADSTYALAWYRFGVLRDWDGHGTDAGYALAQAEAYAHQLSEHDRRLLTAYRAHVDGDPRTAERLYRELIEEDPDDFEALMQLGYLYYQYGRQMGVPMSEGVEPLRRALRLNPHPNAAVYLIWELTADPERTTSMLDEADSLARAFVHPPLVHGIAAIRADRNQDSLGFVLAIDSIKNLFSNGPGFVGLRSANTAMTIMQVGTFWGSAPDLAEIIRVAEFLADTIRHMEVYDGRPALTYFAQVDKYDRLNRMHAGLGQWRKSRNAARALDELGNAGGLIQMAVLATLPMPGPLPIDPDSLRQALESWDIDHSSAPFELQWDKETRRYGKSLRLYTIALLNALQGDYKTAMRYVAELEALEPLDNAPTLHLDFAAGARAEVLLRQGRPAEALVALDGAPWRRHYSMEFWLPGEREILMRARIHHALGNHDEALRWYGSSSTGMGWMAPTLLAPSHFWRGEIYEELGDTEKALFHYSQFVKLWRDADPEYQPVVEEVKDHMARLAAEG